MEKKTLISIIGYVVLIALAIYLLVDVIKKYTTPTHEEILEEARSNQTELEYTFMNCSKPVDYHLNKTRNNITFTYSGNSTFCWVLVTYKGYIIEWHPINITLLNNMDTYIDCSNIIDGGGCSQSIVPAAPFSPEKEKPKNKTLEVKL